VRKSKRITNALSWVLSGHVAGQVIRLIGNLILTRLLVPEMFGIMAIANLLLLGVELITDTGVKQHIIRSQKGNDPVYLNTAWTFQIVRGVFICFLLIIFSVAITYLTQINYWPESSIYTDPLLAYVIGIISLKAFINGFTSTKLTIANRDLSLGIVIRVELLSQFLGLVVMIIWAYIDRSIWALVAGALFSSCLSTIFSHVSIKGINNKLSWNKEIIWELLHFAKWILLSSAITFVAFSGDRLILGYFVGAETIGIYSIAIFFIVAIQQVIFKVSKRVAYPVFCETVRKDPDRLKKIYYKFRMPIDVMSLSITGFIFVTGHLLIEFLYDDRYAYAGYMLEILSLNIISMRYMFASDALLAIGKQKILPLIMGVRAVCIYGLLPITYMWFGLEAALWSIVASTFSTIPVVIVLKIKYGLFNIKRELIPLPLFFAGYFLGMITVSLFK